MSGGVGDGGGGGGGGGGPQGWGWRNSLKRMWETHIRLRLLFFSGLSAAATCTKSVWGGSFAIYYFAEKSCCCTRGEYECWCGFHSVRAQRWRVEGKEERTWRETLCGLRCCQVQRFVSVYAHVHVCVCVCVCWRVCGRWREQRIATKRGGRDTEWWRRVKDGERLVLVGVTIWWPTDTQTTCSSHISLWWCCID